MADLCKLIWYAFAGLFRSRASLQAEILAVRHQLNVLRRKSPARIAFSGTDRLAFAWLCGLAPSSQRGSGSLAACGAGAAVGLAFDRGPAPRHRGPNTRIVVRGHSDFRQPAFAVMHNYSRYGRLPSLAGRLGMRRYEFRLFLNAQRLGLKGSKYRASVNTFQTALALRSAGRSMLARVHTAASYRAGDCDPRWRARSDSPVA
jgi:hypothetical protein